MCLTAVSEPFSLERVLRNTTAVRRAAKYLFGDSEIGRCEIDTTCNVCIINGAFRSFSHVHFGSVLFYVRWVLIS